MHPLTILAVGLYGKVLPNQNGAPIRLVVPWKYGFKSTKAITKISLVEKMPETSWMKAGPSEYGFYANVNPTVDHPSWTTSPRPNDGNHLSSTANNHMSKTPIRKVGNDTPMRDVDKIKFAI